MSPDVARCPLGHQITPGWEPLLPSLVRCTVTGMQVSELGRVQDAQTSSSPWQTKPASFTERFPCSFSLTDPLCCTLYLKGNTLAFQNHFQFLKLSAVACLQAKPDSFGDDTAWFKNLVLPGDQPPRLSYLTSGNRRAEWVQCTSLLTNLLESIYWVT